MMDSTVPPQQPPKPVGGSVAHAVVQKKRGVFPSLLKKTKHNKTGLARLTPFQKKVVAPPVSTIEVDNRSSASSKLSSLTDYDGVLFRLEAEAGASAAPAKPPARLPPSMARKSQGSQSKNLQRSDIFSDQQALPPADDSSNKVLLELNHGLRLAAPSPIGIDRVAVQSLPHRRPQKEVYDSEEEQENSRTPTPPVVSAVGLGKSEQQSQTLQSQMKVVSKLPSPRVKGEKVPKTGKRDTTKLTSSAMKSPLEEQKVPQSQSDQGKVLSSDELSPTNLVLSDEDVLEAGARSEKGVPIVPGMDSIVAEPSNSTSKFTGTDTDTGDDSWEGGIPVSESQNLEARSNKIAFEKVKELLNRVNTRNAEAAAAQVVAACPSSFVQTVSYMLNDDDMDMHSTLSTNASEHARTVRSLRTNSVSHNQSSIRSKLVIPVVPSIEPPGGMSSSIQSVKRTRSPESSKYSVAWSDRQQVGVIPVVHSTSVSDEHHHLVYTEAPSSVPVELSFGSVYETGSLGDHIPIVPSMGSVHHQPDSNLIVVNGSAIRRRDDPNGSVHSSFGPPPSPLGTHGLDSSSIREGGRSKEVEVDHQGEERIPSKSVSIDGDKDIYHAPSDSRSSLYTSSYSIVQALKSTSRAGHRIHAPSLSSHVAENHITQSSTTSFGIPRVPSAEMSLISGILKDAAIDDEDILGYPLSKRRNGDVELEPIDPTPSSVFHPIAHPIHQSLPDVKPSSHHAQGRDDYQVDAPSKRENRVAVDAPDATESQKGSKAEPPGETWEVDSPMSEKGSIIVDETTLGTLPGVNNSPRSETNSTDFASVSIRLIKNSFETIDSLPASPRQPNNTNATISGKGRDETRDHLIPGSTQSEVAVYRHTSVQGKQSLKTVQGGRRLKATQRSNTEHEAALEKTSCDVIQSSDSRTPTIASQCNGRHEMHSAGFQCVSGRKSEEQNEMTVRAKPKWSMGFSPETIERTKTSRRKIDQTLESARPNAARESGGDSASVSIRQIANPPETGNIVDSGLSEGRGAGFEPPTSGGNSDEQDSLRSVPSRPLGTVPVTKTHSPGIKVSRDDDALGVTEGKEDAPINCYSPESTKATKSMGSLRIDEWPSTSIRQVSPATAEVEASPTSAQPSLSRPVSVESDSVSTRNVETSSSSSPLFVREAEKNNLAFQMQEREPGSSMQEKPKDPMSDKQCDESETFAFRRMGFRNSLEDFSDRSTNDESPDRFSNSPQEGAFTAPDDPPKNHSVNATSPASMVETVSPDVPVLKKNAAPYKGESSPSPEKSFVPVVSDDIQIENRQKLEMIEFVSLESSAKPNSLSSSIPVIDACHGVAPEDILSQLSHSITRVWSPIAEAAMLSPIPENNILTSTLDSSLCQPNLMRSFVEVPTKAASSAYGRLSIERIHGDANMDSGVSEDLQIEVRLAPSIAQSADGSSISPGNIRGSFESQRADDASPIYYLGSVPSPTSTESNGIHQTLRSSEQNVGGEAMLHSPPRGPTKYNCPPKSLLESHSEKDSSDDTNDGKNNTASFPPNLQNADAIVPMVGDSDSDQEVVAPAVDTVAVMAALESTLPQGDLSSPRGKAGASPSKIKRLSPKKRKPRNARKAKSKATSQATESNQIRLGRVRPLDRIFSKKDDGLGDRKDTEENDLQENHGGLPREIALSPDDPVSDLDQSIRHFPMKQIFAGGSVDVSGLEQSHEEEVSTNSNEEDLDRYAPLLTLARRSERSPRALADSLSDTEKNVSSQAGRAARSSRRKATEDNLQEDGHIRGDNFDSGCGPIPFGHFMFSLPWQKKALLRDAQESSKGFDHQNKSEKSESSDCQIQERGTEPMNQVSSPRKDPINETDKGLSSGKAPKETRGQDPLGVEPVPSRDWASRVNPDPPTREKFIVYEMAQVEMDRPIEMVSSYRIASGDVSNSDCEMMGGVMVEASKSSTPKNAKRRSHDNILDFLETDDTCGSEKVAMHTKIEPSKQEEPESESAVDHCNATEESPLTPDPVLASLYPDKLRDKPLPALLSTIHEEDSDGVTDILSTSTGKPSVDNDVGNHGASKSLVERLLQFGQDALGLSPRSKQELDERMQTLSPVSKRVLETSIKQAKSGTTGQSSKPIDIIDLTGVDESELFKAEDDDGVLIFDLTKISDDEDSYRDLDKLLDFAAARLGLTKESSPSTSTHNQCTLVSKGAPETVIIVEGTPECSTVLVKGIDMSIATGVPNHPFESSNRQQRMSRRHTSARSLKTHQDQYRMNRREREKNTEVSSCDRYAVDDRSIEELDSVLETASSDKYEVADLTEHDDTYKTGEAKSDCRSSLDEGTDEVLCGSEEFEVVHRVSSASSGVSSGESSGVCEDMDVECTPTGEADGAVTNAEGAVRDEQFESEFYSEGQGNSFHNPVTLLPAHVTLDIRTSGDGRIPDDPSSRMSSLTRMSSKTVDHGPLAPKIDGVSGKRVFNFVFTGDEDNTTQHFDDDAVVKQVNAPRVDGGVKPEQMRYAKRWAAHTRRALADSVSTGTLDFNGTSRIHRSLQTAHFHPPAPEFLDKTKQARASSLSPRAGLRGGSDYKPILNTLEACSPSNKSQSCPIVLDEQSDTMSIVVTTENPAEVANTQIDFLEFLCDGPLVVCGGDFDGAGATKPRSTLRREHSMALPGSWDGKSGRDIVDDLFEAADRFVGAEEEIDSPSAASLDFDVPQFDRRQHRQSNTRSTNSAYSRKTNLESLLDVPGVIVNTFGSQVLESSNLSELEDNNAMELEGTAPPEPERKSRNALDPESGHRNQLDPPSQPNFRDSDENPAQLSNLSETNENRTPEEKDMLDTLFEGAESFVCPTPHGAPIGTTASETEINQFSGELSFGDFRSPGRATQNDPPQFARRLEAPRPEEFMNRTTIEPVPCPSGMTELVSNKKQVRGGGPKPEESLGYSLIHPKKTNPPPNPESAVGERRVRGDTQKKPYRKGPTPEEHLNSGSLERHSSLYRTELECEYVKSFPEPEPVVIRGIRVVEGTDVPESAENGTTRRGVHTVQGRLVNIAHGIHAPTDIYVADDTGSVSSATSGGAGPTSTPSKASAIPRVAGVDVGDSKSLPMDGPLPGVFVVRGIDVTAADATDANIVRVVDACELHCEIGESVASPKSNESEKPITPTQSELDCHPPDVEDAGTQTTSKSHSPHLPEVSPQFTSDSGIGGDSSTIENTVLSPAISTTTTPATLGGEGNESTGEQRIELFQSFCEDKETKSVQAGAVVICAAGLKDIEVFDGGSVAPTFTEAQEQRDVSFTNEGSLASGITSNVDQLNENEGEAIEDTCLEQTKNVGTETIVQQSDPASLEIRETNGAGSAELEEKSHQTDRFSQADTKKAGTLSREVDQGSFQETAQKVALQSPEKTYSDEEHEGYKTFQPPHKARSMEEQDGYASSETETSRSAHFDTKTPHGHEMITDAQSAWSKIFCGSGANQRGPVSDGEGSDLDKKLDDIRPEEQISPRSSLKRFAKQAGDNLPCSESSGVADTIRETARALGWGISSRHASKSMNGRYWKRGGNFQRSETTALKEEICDDDQLEKDHQQRSKQLPSDETNLLKENGSSDTNDTKSHERTTYSFRAKMRQADDSSATSTSESRASRNLRKKASKEAPKDGNRSHISLSHHSRTSSKKKSIQADEKTAWDPSTIESSHPQSPKSQEDPNTSHARITQGTDVSALGVPLEINVKSTGALSESVSGVSVTGRSNAAEKNILDNSSLSSPKRHSSISPRYKVLGEDFFSSDDDESGLLLALTRSEGEPPVMISSEESSSSSKTGPKVPFGSSTSGPKPPVATKSSISRTPSQEITPIVNGVPASVIVRGGGPRKEFTRSPRLHKVLERLRSRKRNGDSDQSVSSADVDPVDVDELFSRYDNIVKHMVVFDNDRLQRAQGTHLSVLSGDSDASGNRRRVNSAPSIQPQVVVGKPLPSVIDVTDFSTTNYEQPHQRPGSVISSKERRRSVDQPRSRGITQSTSFGSETSTPSQKARDLRKQLDQALKTSAAIRTTQERLGAELSNFKQKFQQQRESLSPARSRGSPGRRLSLSPAGSPKSAVSTGETREVRASESKASVPSPTATERTVVSGEAAPTTGSETMKTDIPSEIDGPALASIGSARHKLAVSPINTRRVSSSSPTFDLAADAFDKLVSDRREKDTLEGPEPTIVGTSVPTTIESPASSRPRTEVSSRPTETTLSSPTNTRVSSERSPAFTEYDSSDFLSNDLAAGKKHLANITLKKVASSPGSESTPFSSSTKRTTSDMSPIYYTVKERPKALRSRKPEPNFDKLATLMDDDSTSDGEFFSSSGELSNDSKDGGNYSSRDYEDSFSDDDAVKMRQLESIINGLRSADERQNNRSSAYTSAAKSRTVTATATTTNYNPKYKSTKVKKKK